MALPSGTVTFLFTDIEGSTELLKQLGDRYAQLLADQRRILREVFSRWGGHEVDTQGDAFFVSFPRATDALFAVVEIQQALAQHEWPEGVEVRVRMGLHTGEPLAETEGYVGIDVHRAARIASVGHGRQILLSETTSSLVRDALPPDVQLQELGRHRLKDIPRPEGISQLIVAGLPAQFPPLKSLEALPSLSPVASLPLQLPAFLELEPNEPEVFVGRENELEALDRYLQRAIAGEGQMAFLEGGAGSGKSALLGAFAREAACRYPQLLIGCGDCTAYTGSGDPYLPFREALDMLAGNLEAPWRAGKISSDSARTIWEAMTDVVHAIVEDGPDLLSILLPGREVLNRIRSSVQGTAPWIERLATLTDRAQEIPQDPEAVNLFGQVERVLTRCSQASPILIMLDDLQWVDSASVGLLFHLGRNLSGKRIFILGAFRPEEVTARRAGVDHPLKSVLAEFRRLFGDICIDLAQTSEVEGLRFIDELIDHEPNQLDQEFRRTLFLHTVGHPLFTIELLRALTERGEMYRDDQRRWIAASSLDWNTLPEKVDGVIAERIGRLDPNLIETLTVASVEGESFTAQVIARVRGIAEREVLTQLSQELERSHRLVREKGEEQINGNYLSRYQFSHVLFQRYLYSNIGKGQRRLLHGEIARSLEDLYREDPERIALQLGFHYEHAGEDEHAVRTLVEAGDLARRRFGIQEAIDCYQRALSICQRAGELPLSARLQMKLGQAYLDVHEYQAAQLAYEEGFRLRQLWQKDERQADLATPTEVMRIAYHDPLTLDPSRTMEVFSGCALRQLFSGLVECTHNLEIVPDLAESWQVTDDG
ncbi:MAG: AAA family ATPase, partial [Anaerolineales bacterium]